MFFFCKRNAVAPKAGALEIHVSGQPEHPAQGGEVIQNIRYLRSFNTLMDLETNTDRMVVSVGIVARFHHREHAFDTSRVLHSFIAFSSRFIL